MLPDEIPIEFPGREQADGESTKYYNRLIPLSEIRKNLTGTNWLVYPFIESDVLGVLFGESGALKSFIALDFALSVATGDSYHGHTISKPGPVVYVAGEGQHGLGKRVEAWLIKHELTNTDAPFFLTELPIKMTDESDLIGMARLIREACPDPSMIVIDTVSSNFGNGDESSNNDVALVLAQLSRYLKSDTSACVLLVHHSGHGAKERERGAYAFRANVDFRMQVERHQDDELLINLSCLKMKDHQHFKPVSFKAEYVPIPGLQDSIGQPEGSLVLSMVDYQGKPQTNRESGLQKAIIATLKEELKRRKENKANRGDNTTAAYVPKTELTKLVKETTGTRSDSINRSIDRLITAKTIFTDGYSVWL